MKLELKYPSGQTYGGTLKAGTVKIRMRGDRMVLVFQSEGQGKAGSTLVMSAEVAKRIVHGIELAYSTEETWVQFPLGENSKK